MPRGGARRARASTRAPARRELLAHFGVQTLEAFGCEDLPLATAAAGRRRCATSARRRGATSRTSRACARATPPTGSPSTPARAATSSSSRPWPTARGAARCSGARRDAHRHGRARACGTGSCVRSPASSAIQDRLDAVEELAFRTVERGRLREALGGVQDLDRIIGRVTLGTAGPRDLAALARRCARSPPPPACLAECVRAAGPRRAQGRSIRRSTWRTAIEATLVDDPPATPPRRRAPSATASTPSSTSCAR